MAKFIGCKLRLETKDGPYEGILHNIEEKCGRLTLEKVNYFTKDGLPKPLKGKLMHFFKEDITNVNVVHDEQSKDIVDNAKTELPDSWNSARPKLLAKAKFRHDTRHLSRLKEVEDEDLVFAGKIGRWSKAKRSPQTGSDEDDRLPNENYVIVATPEELKKTLELLSEEDCVGMAAQGVSLGREGQLGWLQLACAHQVYLLDMVALAALHFPAELKEFLENREVQKVIHDCRFLSDFLHHRHQVKLVNVFDTMAADAVVYQLYNDGCVPRYANPLHLTLRTFLQIPDTEISIQRVRAICNTEDEQVWMDRPASADIIDAAIKNVKHLLRLRNELVNALLIDLTAGVNVFLKTVRDAPETTIPWKTRHMLPPQFKNLQVHRPISKAQLYSGRNDRQDDVDKNIRVNSVPTWAEGVHFSRDSMWHMATPSTLRRGRAKSSTDLVSLKTQTPSPLLTSAPAQCKAQPIAGQGVGLEVTADRMSNPPTGSNEVDQRPSVTGPPNVSRLLQALAGQSGDAVVTKRLSEGGAMTRLSEGEETARLSEGGATARLYEGGAMTPAGTESLCCKLSDKLQTKLSKVVIPPSRRVSEPIGRCSPPQDSSTQSSSEEFNCIPDPGTSPSRSGGSGADSPVGRGRRMVTLMDLSMVRPPGQGRLMEALSKGSLIQNPGEPRVYITGKGRAAITRELALTR